MRLLISFLVMLIAVGGYAKDSYVETIKEFCHLNGDAGQITSALKMLNSELFVADGTIDLDELAERYFEDQLVTKVADELKDRNVSEAEIKRLNSRLSSPAGKDFVAHRLAWTEALRGELTTELMLHIPQIMSGKISEPIQPKAGIEPGYIDEFKKFMGASITESFMKMFDESSGMMKLDVLPEGTKKGLMSWMENNLATLALNSAHGIITDDDLGFASKLYSEEAFKKAQDIVTKNFDPTANGKIVDMMSDYINWMKDQGATTIEGVTNLFRLMKGVM